MLSYMRNKTVGITGPEDGLFFAHGLLDDSIYSLWVDLTIDGATGDITAIKGRFMRYTTPDCPAALDHLTAAVGKNVFDPELVDDINKSVGRAGCRHFANLILECCDAAAKALELSKPDRRPVSALRQPADAAGREKAVPTHGPEIKKPPENRTRDLKPAPEGFFLDLHTHTYPASQCASDSADRMILAAKTAGLDGICFTDHNHIWTPAEIKGLRDKHGFLVLAGTEITCVEGDFLVFGMDTPVKGIIPLQALRQMVDPDTGFIIAAHPFRGFLVVGGDSLNLDAKSAMARPVFKLVDAVEVLNSRLNVRENRLAREVATGLGLPATGGSDAHKTEDVGRCVTRFSVGIRNEAELVSALWSGEYAAESFSTRSMASKGVQ